MRDPYDILGVSKTATADELKSAYRKLAKKLHPDVNPGKKDIEQKFKEVTAAYDLVSDPAKRARYDRGEIDGMGNERGFSGRNPYGSSSAGGTRWRNRASASSAGADPFGGLGAENIEDILSQFMGGGGRSAGNRSARGGDITYSLAVPFTEACLGGKRRVTLESGKTIDVSIPAGTEPGHKLRLRGQGQNGPGGAGDAIIEIQIEPHAFFTRTGNDITVEAPISISEAVLGASVKVPTLDGQVTVKVPPGANTGTSLRLKGKGVPKASGDAGDMFVKLKIMLPEPMPEDLTEAIEKWSKKNSYNPRKKLGWAQ